MFFKIKSNKNQVRHEMAPLWPVQDKRLMEPFLFLKMRDIVEREKRGGGSFPRTPLVRSDKSCTWRNRKSRGDYIQDFCNDFDGNGYRRSTTPSYRDDSNVQLENGDKKSSPNNRENVVVIRYKAVLSSSLETVFIYYTGVV